MHTSIAFSLVLISSVYSADYSTNSPHYSKYKSFPSALAECAQYYELSSCSLDRIVRESYPNEPEVRRLIRCTLINLRAWNDTTGVQEQVMNSFFNPTPEDSCSLSRTRECIQRFEQLSGDSSDVQTRAYDAFVCYYRQYGDLNRTDQYLPYNELESEQLVLTALSMANVSQEGLEQFSEGNVLDNPEFPAVFYTLYVRAGFYQEGLLLERLYIRYGNPEFLAPQMEQCVNAVENSLPCNVDDKELLYQIFRNCLQDLTLTLSFVQELSRQLLGKGPSCSDDSSGSSTNAPTEACSTSSTSTTSSPTTTTRQAPYYNAGPR